MVTSLLVHPDEVSKTWIDRMADSGISVLGIHPAGGKKAVDSLTDLLQRVNTPEFRELIDYAKTVDFRSNMNFMRPAICCPERFLRPIPNISVWMARATVRRIGTSACLMKRLWSW